MRLSFDSIEEVQAFVKQLKGTRGKKDDGEAEATGSAPQPLAPPAGGAMAGFPQGGAPTGFAPPAGGAGPAGGAFPAAAAPVMAPEVAALVNRIVARMDGAVSSGATKAEDMLTWFRQQCSPVDASAANADLAQIKGIFLPKLTVPALDHIAKLMGA
jgi:hypothetical protein